MKASIIRDVLKELDLIDNEIHVKVKEIQELRNEFLHKIASSEATLSSDKIKRVIEDAEFCMKTLV